MKQIDRDTAWKFHPKSRASLGQVERVSRENIKKIAFRFLSPEPLVDFKELITSSEGDLKNCSSEDGLGVVEVSKRLDQVTMSLGNLHNNEKRSIKETQHETTEKKR